MSTSISTVDRPQDPTSSLIIIADEPLWQDCMVVAMSSEFPLMRIEAITTIQDLQRPMNLTADAVLLRIRSGLVNLNDLAQDIRTIGRFLERVPVIVISRYDDADSVEAAIAAGAQGLIPVTASLKIAVAAVRLVLAGGTYFPRPVMSKVDMGSNMPEITEEATGLAPANTFAQSVHDYSNGHIGSSTRGTPENLSTAFTARERDVLTALRQGRSNKWIAHQLKLSENTIKVHIRHIMRKLHATNRTEAAILSHNLAADSGN